MSWTLQDQSQISDFYKTKKCLSVRVTDFHVTLFRFSLLFNQSTLLRLLYVRPGNNQTLIKITRISLTADSPKYCKVEYNYEH